jgi:hemerythrin-like metal-binding protein
MDHDQLAVHLETGVAEIDTMHKKIAMVLDSLREQCIRLTPEPIIQATLDQLRSLATEHFLLEEQLMEEIAYPEIAVHVGEHRQFQQEFPGLIQALSREQDGSRRGVVVEMFLKEWLERHTLLHDVPLGEFIRSRRRQQLAGFRKLLHAVFTRHFEQIMGGLATDLWSLVWPWRQPVAMAGYRARIILSRVRLLAWLFAL